MRSFGCLRTLLLRLVVSRRIALPAILAVAVAVSSLLASPSHAAGICEGIEVREFSDSPDLDSTGAADSGQVLLFDCAGGVTDSTDLKTSGGEIDGLAASLGDHYIYEVINNNTVLVFSVEGDRSIYLEDVFGAASMLGPLNLAQIDVDALEFWGDEPADLYSLVGDPGGIAVFDSTGAAVITQSQLLAGVQSLDVGLGLTADQIQLDAMISDTTDGKIVYSVEPVGDLDGGEIFVLDLGTETASYLNHGGHLWNTAFDVMGTFGVGSENVNALEALPEPSTALLVGFGLILLGARARVRRGSKVH